MSAQKTNCVDIANVFMDSTSRLHQRKTPRSKAPGVHPRTIVDAFIHFWSQPYESDLLKSSYMGASKTDSCE